MNQSKTTTSSPKSLKMHGDSSNFNDSSSSSSESDRSPSTTESSPGSNESLSHTDRLGHSTGGVSYPAWKSSPSTNLTNAINTSKPDVSKELEKEETTDEFCIGSSEEIIIQITQFSNENEISVELENERSAENEGTRDSQDICEESSEIEVKDDENAKLDWNGSVVMEDLNSLTKPLRIDDSIIVELTSKRDIRQKVWEFLEENSLVVFSNNRFNCIPHFTGYTSATELLEKLDEFKKAKTVQVTPDKAHETARFVTLKWGKRLLVPFIRLNKNLVQNISIPFTEEPSTQLMRSAISKKGLRKRGNESITLDRNDEGHHHIDMIILGSVAVDRKGRRIGIGNGFCDLEFVILNSMNMVTDKTVIVTIVHDAQVYNSLPSDIFKSHDVPVDIIVTPTEIIRVAERLDRPKDVLWNCISKRRLAELPPLQLLRTKQENDTGLNCTLKETDSELEEIPSSSYAYKKFNGYRRRRSTRSETDSVFDTDASKICSKKSVRKAKPNHDCAEPTTSQQDRRSLTTTPSNRRNDQNERPAEFAKPTTSPATDPENSVGSRNTDFAGPSSSTPENKRRSQRKPHRPSAVYSGDDDDDDDTTVRPSQNRNSSQDRRLRGDNRTCSNRTRRRDTNGPVPVQGNGFADGPSQNRYGNSSQDRRLRGDNRTCSNRTRRRHTNGPVPVQGNGFADGPAGRKSRYFVSSNAPISSRNFDDRRNNVIGRDSDSRAPMSHRRTVEHNDHRDSFSLGSIRRESNTDSTVDRPPRYSNKTAPKTVDGNGQERKPRHRFNNTVSGFLIKVGNIANNVRLRDLKAALTERGVKPLNIIWRGPRGFAYLRYGSSNDKDNAINSLRNVCINLNRFETSQTQTLIVTECLSTEV